MNDLTAGEQRAVRTTLLFLRVRAGGAWEPVARALRGIPSYPAEAGSCTMVNPPSPLIAVKPRVPSLPVPDRIMPTALSP